MSPQLETAMQLLKLAERYLDEGEAAKAAHALAQAEPIVTEVAKRQAIEDVRNQKAVPDTRAPGRSRTSLVAYRCRDWLNRHHGKGEPGGQGAAGRVTIRATVLISTGLGRTSWCLRRKPKGGATWLS